MWGPASIRELASIYSFMAVHLNLVFVRMVIFQASVSKTPPRKILSLSDQLRLLLILSASWKPICSTFRFNLLLSFINIVMPSGSGSVVGWALNYPHVVLYCWKSRAICCRSCVYSNENTRESQWAFLTEPVPRYAHQFVYNHVTKVCFLICFMVAAETLCFLSFYHATLQSISRSRFYRIHIYFYY